MVKKQLSDEQIDALMRSLVNESAADEALLSEIADSPATWWGVQRKINSRRAETLSAWPPVGKVLRWLLAGGAVTAAAVLILTLFVFRQASTNDNDTVASLPTLKSTLEKPSEPLNAPSRPTAVEATVSEETEPATQIVRHIVAKPQVAEKRSLSARSATTNPVRTEVANKATKKEEIKTEFIALSYAQDPESGQIVRVKVPSAMMVSLGLVNNVKTPSELVDAEVLVGDDGLTRAIRFIR